MHAVWSSSEHTAADMLPAALWYCDEPTNDAALLPNLMVETMLGKHVKVALNGTGGDELFCGYGRYFQLPIEKKYLMVPAWMRRHMIEPAMGMIAPTDAWRLRRAEKFWDDRGGYLHDHTSQFPQAIRKLIGNNMAAPLPAQGQAFPSTDIDSQTGALIADLSTYLPEDLLLLLDRTSMAASVEGRVPFLDHRLVEAALAVPSHIRTANNAQKALEREMARKFLPDSVIKAPKQGFASPVGAWMKQGLATTAQRVLTRRQTLDRGWWSKSGIDRLAADPQRHGFRLYSLMVLELCVRLHIEAPLTMEAPTEPLQSFAEAA